MGVSIVMGVPPVITPVLWDVPFINRGTSIYGTLHIGFPKHHGGKTIAELQSWPVGGPLGLELAQRRRHAPVASAGGWTFLEDLGEDGKNASIWNIWGKPHETCRGKSWK